MSMIKIENLTFGYTSRDETLKDINLEIEEAKFTTIIGENGSGKSTLINCIVGLCTGYKGNIEVNEKVGYLPQRMNIQSDFPASVKEIVLSGTISRNINSIFYKKEDKQKSQTVMKDLEIYDLRNKSFAELSGGQQQRVLIGRALCATKNLIILDEPTNGLDPNIAVQIYSLLDKLKKELKLTILIVSHDIERSLKHTDNVIEMKNGKVIYNGDVVNFRNGGSI